MAAPRRNPHHNRNRNRNNNSTWTRFFVQSGVALTLVGGAWYIYNRYYGQPSIQQRNDEDNDSNIPLYHPTPLGDFDDTDDTNMNTTFYYQTPNGNGPDDGQKMNVRQEYISTLLQQRRFSSVLCNDHLHHHREEYYFHLGFSSSSPLLSHFNRVKWVIIVRSKADVKLVATRILNEFPQFIEEKNDGDLPKPIGSEDRFYMLRISSIIIVSCGIGGPSISILLQEITKVLVDAGAFAPNENNTSLNFQTSYVEYILLISAPGIKTSPSKRMAVRRKSLSNILDATELNRASSSGSLDRSRSGSTTPRGSKRFDLSSLKVDLKAERQRSSDIAINVNDDDEKRPSQITGGEVPVIIPTSCYNEKLSNYLDHEACGNIIGRQMKFDRNLIHDIKLRCSFLRSLKPKQGKGLSVQYFNEALSYNSVSINQDQNIKSKFIQSCIDQGIKYVDMESGYFASFCNTLSISCVTIVGIEYDIAAPSKKDSGNMRVSHQTALQATLDIFCQYLWDRISQDIQQKKSIDRAQSGNNLQPPGNDDVINGDMDQMDIASLEKSNSYQGPMTNTENILKPRNKGNKRGQDDAAAPAAYSDNFDFNDNQKDNEGFQ